MTEFKKISGKFDEKKIDVILVVCCIFAGILMLARQFFGVETTDEAYYIADTMNALRGNYPFAYNFSSAAGMNLITMPLVALYQCFVPDSEGIFLFMRLSFTVFRFSLLAASYFLLRKTHKKRILLLAILFMIPFCGAIVANWSYNTISVWLVFFVGVLLGTALEDGALKRVYISAGISGILISFAELAHPLNFLNVLFFGAVILFCGPKGGRIKAAVLYAAAGIANTAVVLGVIALKAGMDHLLCGMSLILSSGGKAVGRVNSEKWLETKYYFGYLWLFMIAAAVGFVLLYVAVQKKKRQPCRLQYAVQTAAALLVLGSTAGTLALLRFKLSTTDLSLFGGALLIPLVLLFLLRVRTLFFFMMTVPPVLFCFTELWMTKNSAAIGRFYYLIPLFFAIFIVLSESGYRTVRCLAVAACLLGICVLMGFQYLYVYRDVPISRMDFRMPSGIYKGIYTEAQRGKDTLELEEYIHSVTEKDEWIKFCDNVPAGYLFQDGKMCDVRAWDNMNYTYNKNNPTKMYRYFINREAIPDKLIYVDFKRDPQLSIEDGSWKFNEFVDEFYEFAGENVLNATYRVKLYLRTREYGEFLDWAQSRLP